MSDCSTGSTDIKIVPKREEVNGALRTIFFKVAHENKDAVRKTDEVATASQ